MSAMTGEEDEEATGHELAVVRGPYRLYAELTPAAGILVVLMHGFPDNTRLYDRLMPHMVGRAPLVRFDFLGWGGSDKPQGYPYTHQTRRATWPRSSMP